jgi:hypothetical protein
MTADEYDIFAVGAETGARAPLATSSGGDAP